MPRGAQARFAARVPGAGAAAGLGEFVAPAGDSETAIAALWREELAWRNCAPAPGAATAAKRAGAVQGAPSPCSARRCSGWRATTTCCCWWCTTS